MRERPYCGIFSGNKLGRNEAEMCVISDVHIGSGERNDYVFGGKAGAQTSPVSGEAYTLRRFCEKVTESGRLGELSDGRHKLVLLGDIVNGECGYFASYNSPAYRMLMSSFLPWVQEGNVIYIKGNHDKEAELFSPHMTGFPKKFVVDELDCGGVIFEHGHQFDPLCDGKSLVGMMGSAASSLAVRLLSPDVEDLVRGRKFYHDHSQGNGLRSIPNLSGLSGSSETESNDSRNVRCGAALRIKKLRKQEDFELANGLTNERHCAIVCGHTHQRPVEIVDDSYVKLSYFNSGKFARDGYILIRTKYNDRYGAWELV